MELLLSQSLNTNTDITTGRIGDIIADVNRPGPALGEQDLRISDDLSQTALDVPISCPGRPSAACRNYMVR